MTAAPKPALREAGARPLRHNTDFMMLWIGAGCSQLAAQMSTITFPLLVIWHTGSPVGAGVVSFGGLLPMLLLQLPAGVVVDHWDRRRLMMLCDVIAATGMLSVAAALVFGVVWLPHLFAVAFVETTCMIFYQLAERTGVRNVVEPEHLATAVSRNEGRGRAAGLLGGPAGSSLFAVLWWLPFVAIAAGHVISLGSLSRVKRPLQTERGTRRRNLRAEVAEGMRWLWQQRFLRAATVVVAATNFLAQIVNLSPIVIIKDSGGSAALVGLVGLTSGIGGVCGALSGSWLLRRLSLGSTLLLDLVARSVLVPMMAFVTAVSLLLPPFAIMAFTGAMLNVGAGAYMARIVPDRLHGTALSTLMLISNGANSAGALTAGLMLGLLGTTVTLLSVGGALVVVTVAAALTPAVRGGLSAVDRDVSRG